MKIIVLNVISTKCNNGACLNSKEVTNNNVVYVKRGKIKRGIVIKTETGHPQWKYVVVYDDIRMREKNHTPKKKEITHFTWYRDQIV